MGNSDSSSSALSSRASSMPVTTSTQSSTHDADSLDKILADLEAQLKAKQDGAADALQNNKSHDEDKKLESIADAPAKPHVELKTDPVKTSSLSPVSVSTQPLATKKPTELMVEEKHDLMKVQNDVVPTIKAASTASVTESSHAPIVAEHPFIAGSGIAAAQKKVVPEVVGAAHTSGSDLGTSPMKKDTAVSKATPSMPGVVDIKMDGSTAPPMKLKKRNRVGVIAGIAVLIFTVIGTGAGIVLNLMPGGVFDPRRYAADNMCNVRPGSCTSDQDWINGWYEARQSGNENATPQQTEYTNRDNATVEVIRNAGDSNAVNYSGQSEARGDNVAVSGTNPNQNSAAEAARVTAMSFSDRSKEDAKNLQAEADKAKAAGDTKKYDKLIAGVKEAQAQAKAMEGIGAGTKSNEEIKRLMDAARAEAAAASSGVTGSTSDTSGGSVYNHAAFKGQTLDNMCNTDSYKKCDKYQDWIDGWVEARKQDNFGKTASKPEYTDAAKDLDGDSSNGRQVGLITRDAQGRLVVNEMVTLDVPAGTTDDQIKNMTNNLSVKSGTKVAVYQDASGKIIALGGGNNGTGVPEAWKALAISGGCKQPTNLDPSTGTIKAGDAAITGGTDLYCHGSNGVDFCVPGGWSKTDGKTCDGYFVEFGIPVRYQAFGTNKAPDGTKLTASYIAQFCGTAEDTKPVSSSLGAYNVITCNGSPTYTQCVDHLNGTFTCYLRDKNGIAGSAIPASAGFKLTSGGDCLEPTGKDSGTQFNAFNCDPNVSGGCQDNGKSYSGKMCLSSVIASLGVSCGRTIQIDADDTQGNHYSINQWLPACGTPRIDTPPQIVNRPPTTQTLCTVNCGGTDVTPSPPPPGSPVCVGISASIPAPVRGQSPTFTCSPAAEATRYEFRSKIGTGAYATLAPSAANSNVSSPLTVNASGVYTIQCRPCNANGCANWENL